MNTEKEEQLPGKQSRKLSGWFNSKVLENSVAW